MGIKNVEPSLLPVPLSKAFELAHVIRTSNEDPTLYVYTLNPPYLIYREGSMYTNIQNGIYRYYALMT